MSNYISFEDLNETFFPSTTETILKEIWRIYVLKYKDFDEFCLLLENTINDAEKKSVLIKKVEVYFHELSNEFYVEFNNLILSDSSLGNLIIIQSEINTIDGIIQNLNDTYSGAIKNQSIIDFIQNECKTLLKETYSNSINRIASAFLKNEHINNVIAEKKLKLKSYFDTGLDLKNDDIFIELRAKLIEKKFIKEIGRAHV